MDLQITTKRKKFYPEQKNLSSSKKRKEMCGFYDQFPAQTAPEVWFNVFAKLGQQEKLAFFRASPQWHKLVANKRTQTIFPEMIPILMENLQKTCLHEFYWYRRKEIESHFLRYRELCGYWSKELDKMLQGNRYRFNWFKPCKELFTYESWRNSFTTSDEIRSFVVQMNKHPGNPFPGRNILIRHCMERNGTDCTTYWRSVNDILGRFGTHVYFATIDMTPCSHGQICLTSAALEEILNHLSQLKGLYFNKRGGGSEVVIHPTQPLAHFAHLETINFSNIHPSVINFVLNSCGDPVKLKRLYLQRCHVSYHFFSETVSKFVSLETLKLNQTWPAGQDFERFCSRPHMPPLRKLELNGLNGYREYPNIQWFFKTLQVFKGTLVSLTMNQRFSYDELDFKIDLPKLRKLYLAEFKWKNVEPFQLLKELSQLTIRDLKIDDYPGRTDFTHGRYLSYFWELIPSLQMLHLKRTKHERCSWERNWTSVPNSNYRSIERNSNLTTIPECAVWLNVFEKLDRSDKLVFSRACLNWHQLAAYNRTEFLFLELLPRLMDELPQNCCLKSREVCESWRMEQFRQLLTHNYNYSFYNKAGHDMIYFTTLEEIQTFLDEMKENSGNPFGERSVYLGSWPRHCGDTRPIEEICMEYWPSLYELLERVGHHVFDATIDMQRGEFFLYPKPLQSELLTAFRNILNRIPRVRKLCIKKIPASERFEKLIKKHLKTYPFARLEHLESITFHDVQVSIPDVVLKLCVVPAKLKELSIDNCFHGHNFLKTVSKFGNLEILQIKKPMNANDIMGQYFERFCSPLATNVPPLRELELDYFRNGGYRPTIQWISNTLKVFKETLVKLRMGRLSFENDESNPWRNLEPFQKLKELIIEYCTPFDFEGNMYDSVIWELIPSLQKLDLKGIKHERHVWEQKRRCVNDTHKTSIAHSSIAT